MLKTKYFKDMNHNYLIINCPEDVAIERYQLKMITDNNIPGLLSVSKRNIDGEAFLYYEINSLQTLQAMFENRKMDKKMAIRLLGGLRRVLQEMKSYLLSDGGLILKPDYVYLNWEREEIYFTYFPFENEVDKNQVKFFFEYLVRVIDHRDEHLTDAVYGLCQLADRGMFTAEELERHLSEMTFEPTEQINCEQQIFDYAPSSAQMEKDEFPMIPEAELPSILQSENLSEQKNNERKQKIKFLIMAAVSAAGAIFTILYQQYFILTDREILLSWILLVVFLVFFLITGVIFIFLQFGFLKTKSKTIPEPAFQVIHENEYYQRPQAKPSEEVYGDTVFLYDQEEMRENKLYGINKGNKHVIDIIKFPFTIGKIAENTDFCLKENSVSRIHVRFSQSENIILMTDLNSTNGTFKNGLRLDPNETVALEAGDEIRLGKLSFCYR
jgi:hypothetical protein